MLSSALQNISDGVISEIGQVFSAIGLPERHGNELGRTGASALCAVVLLPHTGRTRSLPSPSWRSAGLVSAETYISPSKKDLTA